jgi:hypothetical protein
MDIAEDSADLSASLDQHGIKFGERTAQRGEVATQGTRTPPHRLYAFQYRRA